MKSTLLSFIILLLSITSNAQVLIGYYPLNENADDLSGYDHHGIATAVLPTTDRFAQIGKAYSFNGTNSKIEVPDNPLLALTENYSISTWAKASFAPGAAGSTNGFALVSKNMGLGINNPKWAFLLQNGKLAFHINGAGLTNGLWVYSNLFTLNLNQWYHCAMSKSGNNLTFYINGKNLGTFTLTSPSVNPIAPLI